MLEKSVRLNRKRKAIVIGGSLSGLFAGNMLRKVGWDVDIYERSVKGLDGRGAGVVLQSTVGELYRALGTSIDSQTIPSRERNVYASDGTLLSSEPAKEIQTSWGRIFSSMRQRFPDAHYHLGKTLSSIEQVDKTVTAFFADGSSATGDLLIGADGGRSTVRSLVNPINRSRYSGYIAWRGMIQDADIPAEARSLLRNFTLSSNTNSHILGYSVPESDDVSETGIGAYNWVWYRPIEEHAALPDLMTDRFGVSRPYSIPPGRLTDYWLEQMDADAAMLLPPAFREIVHATPQPFAQAILDLTNTQTVYNRVLLMGEAAFLLRPHMGIGTSKAASDALALGKALDQSTTDDAIDQALASWQIEQVHLGQQLHRQGVAVGTKLRLTSDSVSA